MFSRKGREKPQGTICREYPSRKSRVSVLNSTAQKSDRNIRKQERLRNRVVDRGQAKVTTDKRNNNEGTKQKLQNTTQEEIHSNNNEKTKHKPKL